MTLFKIAALQDIAALQKLRAIVMKLVFVYGE